MTPSAKRVCSYGVAVALATFGAAACQVEANANVKASGDMKESSASTEENVSSTPPAETAAAAPTPAPAAAECPLSCYEAQGPTRVLVRDEEQTQLRTALEPVLRNMRACGSDEYRGGRNRGSATVHLRIAPDGTLADMGVDPQERGDTACYQSAVRGQTPTVSLPGRKAVRCVERCAPAPGEAPARRRGGRGR